MRDTLILRIIYSGGGIDPEALRRVLNKELQRKNIVVEKTAFIKTGGASVITISARLAKPLKYSEIFSEKYDESVESMAAVHGSRFAKILFGTEAQTPHWYHKAILVDTIIYILEALKRKGKIKEYAVVDEEKNTYRSPEWRKTVKTEYNPEKDPAFLRRIGKPVKRLHGAPVYADREKMIEYLFSDKLDKLLAEGKMRPEHLEDYQDAVLDATKAISFFEEITVPDTLWSEKPLFQAYMIWKYGGPLRAEHAWKKMSGEEKNRLYDEMREWLRSANPVSREFKEFLHRYKERLRAHVEWAKEVYGPFATKLLTNDGAGVTLEEAKKLLREPYRPQNIASHEIESIVGERKRSVKLLK